MANELIPGNGEAQSADSKQMEQILSPELLTKMDAYWRAANYLSVGQIYLKDNPLLERPLTLDDVKPRLLGHWGTTPGLNFHLCALNRAHPRARSQHDLHHRSRTRRAGHVANTYLEGSYTEMYPAHRAECGRHQASVPPVQLALRHSQPRRAGNAGLDSRGRRAGLFAGACLRRGLRQPRSHRHLRRRRWRSGDRPARHKLALEQIPQSRDRRRSAARSSTSTATRSPTPRCSRAFRMPNSKS